MGRGIYGKILFVNLKYNFRMPFASAFGVFVLTLILFNITALQSQDAAKPIEFLLCFIGVMLLVPVLYPEQDENIRDVIRSKKIDYVVVCIIRIVYSVVAIVVFVAALIIVMKMCESDVGIGHFISGIASAWLLGAVGFAAAGMSNNVIIGYMTGILYYLANYGLKDKWGPFFLFSMSYSGKYDAAGWKIFGAVVLMGITLLVCSGRRYCFGSVGRVL